MYAIVETGGKQYRVEEGQILQVEKLPAQPGDRVELPVLAVVRDGGVTLGNADPPASRVLARVMDHFRGRKILVFKYRAKVNYRRKTGHRQWHTRLRIERIEA